MTGLSTTRALAARANIRLETYIHNVENGIYDARWLMSCITAAIYDSSSRCESEYTIRDQNIRLHMHAVWYMTGLSTTRAHAHAARGNIRLGIVRYIYTSIYLYIYIYIYIYLYISIYVYIT